MRAAVTAVVLVVVAVAPAATAADQATQTVGAEVEAVATVMVGNVATNFEFDVFNCPAGAEMEVSWTAEQPAREPGNGVVGAQAYGRSTGDRVQHLTLTAAGNFIAGERWVGSGVVVCGAAVVPVEGTGTTHSQTGV